MSTSLSNAGDLGATSLLLIDTMCDAKSSRCLQREIRDGEIASWHADVLSLCQITSGLSPCEDTGLGLTSDKLAPDIERVWLSPEFSLVTLVSFCFHTHKKAFRVKCGNAWELTGHQTLWKMSATLVPGWPQPDSLWVTSRRGSQLEKNLKDFLRGSGWG